MQNMLLGIGLRYPHYTQVVHERPCIDWFEVHSENFFYSNMQLTTLCTIRQNYPISLHGIGLSLGSATGIDTTHLMRLKHLVDMLDPFLLSEHLSWSRVAGVYLPDLLPLPYTQASLDIFCDNINRAQDTLGREILIENPSSYIEYTASEYAEADFLSTLCRRTGAKILLDINNIFVSCENHGWDAECYLQSIPLGLVKEFHLAGHSVKTLASGKIIRIDTHDQPVCPSVWQLYTKALNRWENVPTLLEWDANIPSLATLIQEVQKARNHLDEKCPIHA